MFFQKLQKFANLSFSDDADKHGFFRVCVHALGLHQRNATMQSRHHLFRQLVGFVGNHFKFVSTSQTLQ